MKPIKVEILNKPRVEPIYSYKRCLNTLFLLKCAYPKYKLLDDMIVVIYFNHSVKKLTIKKDYITDSASIPRFLWKIYPPDGNYRYISIIHDILVQTESFTSKINHLIFKIGMNETVPNEIKNIFYYAVKIASPFVYAFHSKDKIYKAKKFLNIENLINN